MAPPQVTYYSIIFHIAWQWQVRETDQLKNSQEEEAGAMIGSIFS